MAKNNAAFLYENERISSDKAIALLKENDQLNIETEYFKNSNPIVKITTKGVNNSNVNIPPPPPPPPAPNNQLPMKDPIGNIVKLAEKGATFYIDGKKVSSDKAIKELRKDPKIFKINIENQDSDKPIVKLSSC